MKYNNTDKTKHLMENFKNYIQQEDQEIKSVDMSIDDFLKSQPLKEDDTDAATDAATDVISKKAAGEKFSMKSDDPIVHRSNIIDDNGDPLDPEELKRKFSERPTEILNKNAKIAKSGGKTLAFYNITLPAYMGLYHNEKTGKLEITKICFSAGDCKLFCYARKGNFIRYPASSLKATKIITYIKNDLPGFKAQLQSEIEEKERADSSKGMETVIRWHDSGDFLDLAYMRMAINIAEKTPEVSHYAYTKRVKMVSGGKFPDNFAIAYSFGGIEDKAINTKEHRHSRVVPSDLFKDLTYKEADKMHFNDDAAENEFKARLSKEYAVPVNTIITYDELMEIPYDKKGLHKPKYHVIVKGGDGDDAAMRKDVLGIYLLIH